MSRVYWPAALLFVIPAPSPAQIVFEDSAPKPVASKPPDSKAASKSDWDKLQCRAEDVPGTRLERHQVCLTKWQWYSYEREAKERVQDWERLGMASH